VEPRCPTTLRYQTHALSGSLYHTPPTFAIYLVALVAEWALERGGLEALQVRAEERAGALYRLIDQHPSLYQGHARPESRSRMNVTFRLPSAELERRFLSEAEALQLSGLKGHRSVGGIRASLYNAVTDEAVEALLAHMERFARAGS
jgi:phosphoserine aminotransferase